MNKIIYNLVFNRKQQLNEKGTALVQIEAYLNKKRKYFSTNIYLTPAQWDKEKQIIKNHPNSEALNRMLYKQIAIIEQRELRLWQEGKTITLEALKEVLRSDLKEDEKASFLSFFKNEIVQSSLSESTKKNHLSTYHLLSLYKKDISFLDVTFELISSFDLHLRLKSYHINTIAKHMKHLKRYVNVAINKEYIDIQKYPFRKYKIKTINNLHTHLTPDELQKLEKLELSGKHTKLQTTLDAFLFCCYTGLRYSDFISLNSDNILLINKEIWLIYKSVKTKVEVRLPLYLLFEGKSISILERYKDHLLSFFKLRDNSNINKELIKISQLSGLQKHISFHTARHTNATLLIYDGVNITTVQKLLGHKNIKTTQGYTEVMDMTIIRDLEKCMDKFFNRNNYSKTFHYK